MNCSIETDQYILGSAVGAFLLWLAVYAFWSWEVRSYRWALWLAPLLAIGLVWGRYAIEVHWSNPCR